MKKAILFFVLVVVSLNSYAQIHFPDSVKTNKQKVVFLNVIARNHNVIDSSIYYTNKALEYALKTKKDSLILSTKYYKAYYIHNKGNYKEAIKLLLKLKNDKRIKRFNFYNYRTQTILAGAYNLSDNPIKGLYYYNKALAIALKMKDSLLIGSTYNNIGDTYKFQDLDNKAKEYFLLALEVYNKYNVEESEKKITYQNLSRLASTDKELKYYLDKALKIVLKENNKQNTALFYLTKADALFRRNLFKESIASYEKSYKISDTLKFELLKNISSLGIGQNYNQLKKYKKAIFYLEKALSFEQTMPSNHFLILEELSKAYSKNNEYKKAYLTAEKMTILMDSMSRFNTKEKFAEYDAKFKTTEKDKEIAKQQLEIAKQKNNKNKLIIGSLLLLLLLYSIFQWIYNKQKRKKLTTENELQKELEINELRTKFLGNIAHEIRTPLTLIAGNLELAKENINTKDKAVQNIDVALTNSKKVVDDANEILELLKFEKSKITINQNVINLDTTLKRIFYSFKSLAELKKIDLKYQSVISPTIQIKTDVQKVEKIINNLISNAIKYSPSNSEIIFYANIMDENLIIKVTDFGQGIHFDETEKIFQRFYQASNSQSVGGIGIGLSLAKEFAELLNGNLSVKSELTKGSTFTFTLPITKVSEQNIEMSKDVDLINRKDKQDFKTQQTTKQQRQINQNKPNILIVEDNPEMNNYLVEILSNNYNCFSAYDGLEALEKLNKQSFDLITSDIMMPNLNGFQFREKLNEIEKFKNIPFILISAKTLAEDKIKGFKLGIDDYVIKPFNKNELIARIENLLSNKNAREEWTITNKTLISTEENSDKKLLKKIESSILENISDENFKIDDLAKSVGYSQRQLTRILKQYTGMSPVKFILEIRLQKAYANLQNKTFFALSEIRYDVGITSASYFNKKFKERFGIAPNSLL